MLTNDQIEYMEKTYQAIYCGLTPEVYQTSSFYKLAIQAREANQLREENNRLRNKMERGHNGCEGCGIVGATIQYKRVNLINGGLFLCIPCLDEFNSKNPELIALKEEIKKLRNNKLS